jgi:hypothetical protein
MLALKKEESTNILLTLNCLVNTLSELVGYIYAMRNVLLVHTLTTINSYS